MNTTSFELGLVTNGDGLFTRGKAGETLGERKLVHLDSNGSWMLGDTDVPLHMPCIGITKHTIQSGMYGVIILKGFIGDLTWNWDMGDAVYPSSTPGELTQTVPSASAIQQIAGYAFTPTTIYFSPRQSRGGTEIYYVKTESIPVESLGRPNTNPPTVVDQDNLRLLGFTVNTDSVSIKLPVPADWVSGDLKFNVIWTNDGGVDDLNKNVKVQMDYQVGSEGDVISGSHANSPKTVDDTYTSDSGWVEHHTGYMTIAEADFGDEFCVYAKFSFVTATAMALTGDPHMIGICIQYNASPDR